jgi:hypothetical protein
LGDVSDCVLAPCKLESCSNAGQEKFYHPAPLGPKQIMLSIVPRGCTKPCLRFRRKREGSFLGPERALSRLKGPSQARKGPLGPEGPERAQGVGPQIPVVEVLSRWSAFL